MSPTFERLLSIPYPAQKSEEPAGFLWGRSYCQRVARFGHPLPAFDSHDPSDSDSTPPRDPQTAGPTRKGPPLPCPLAHRQNDVHQIDFIVGHYLSSQRPVVILNRKDVATGLGGGMVELRPSGAAGLGFFGQRLEHHGAPRFLQMDNDMSLTGGHMHPRSLGQVIRLCLACRVVPVFTPERRPATNARVERYNGLWQEKVWKRYRFRTLGQLQRRSLAFQDAYNTHLKQRLNRQGSRLSSKPICDFCHQIFGWGIPCPFIEGRFGLSGE